MRSNILGLSFVTLLTGCGDLLADTVAFGDSVTFGYGGERGGWVSHLEDVRGSAIANFGVPSEQVVNGKGRFAGPLGPLSLAPNAKHLLLLHGGNDLGKSFLDAPCDARCEPWERAERMAAIAGWVEDIAQMAQRHDLEVTLGTYWRVNAEVCNEQGGPHLEAKEAELANFHLDLYNAHLLEVASRNNLEVVRLDQLGLDADPANFYDCIHPSDDGYRLVADAWGEFVR